MKNILLMTIVMLCAATPCRAEEADRPAPAAIEVRLSGNDGKDIAAAKVTAAPKGVIISVEATGLPPGWHGVHIHGKGDCSDHDHFKNAGGHMAKEGQNHGFLSGSGPHDGDLPNLWVAADGSGKAEFYSEAAKGLLDRPEGAALVIHGGPDDYATDPSGNSGDRIACGVIKAPQGQ